MTSTNEDRPESTDAQTLRHALRGVRAAFIFLTRVPVGGFPYQTVEWKWANAHFPLVGAFLGACSGLVYWCACDFDATFAAVLAVATSIWMTGAFHEDGLADSADALGGGIDDKPRVLEILKDSRIGTYGTAGFVMVLLARVALLSKLTALPGLLALVSAHSLARVPPIWIKTFLPYASEGPLAKSRDLESSSSVQVVVATAWGLLLGVLFVPSLTTLIWIALALAILGRFLAWRFERRVGGYTGDFLGATEQLGEVVVLLAFAITMG